MTPKELEKMTKAELLKLARSKKISITTRMLKSDLIKAIKKQSKPKKSRPAAKRPASRKPAAKAAKKARTRKTVTGKAARKAGAKKTTKAKGAAPKKAPVEKAAARKPAAKEKRLAARTIRQKAEAGKYYLGAEDKVMPPVESMEIPPGYNIDRIAVMVRDPHWIFSYWEVTLERFRRLERHFGKEWPSCRMILRVSDKSSGTETHFDISINSDARNWYINVSPERRYQVSIGVLGPDGRFVEIAASNIVETPREGISNVIDDRWMIPDEIFERIFAASGGYDMQDGSAELRELLERRLLEQISSGAVSSIGSGALRKEVRGRGFRLWVATELILYGATEPDARVTIRGKPVKLRGDGTFSVRFALPDGKIDMPVTAVSSDEMEERTIETAVEKGSKKKEPVLK